MELSTFVFVAVVSIALTIAWHCIFYIVPAYKKLKTASALLALAKYVRAIDENPLLDGTISKGGHLHDNIYKLLQSTLINKVTLHFSMLRQISINKNELETVKKFQGEMDALDKDTRRLIDQAMFTVAKILMFRNPVVFMLIYFKIRKTTKHEETGNTNTKLRKKMIVSAKAIAVNAKTGDYSLSPC